MSREEMINWLYDTVKHIPIKCENGEFLVGTLFGFPVGTQDELMALLFAFQVETQRDPWGVVKLAGEA